MISPVVTPVDNSDQKNGAFESDAPEGILIWYEVSAKAKVKEPRIITTKGKTKRGRQAIP